MRANKWKGLRQDSGDPFKFIPVAIEAFKRVGADPKTSALRQRLPDEQELKNRAEVIVFSDALDVERCNKLKKASDEAGIGCSFGVGTYLTNGSSSRFVVPWILSLRLRCRLQEGCEPPHARSARRRRDPRGEGEEQGAQHGSFSSLLVYELALTPNAGYQALQD